MGIARLREGIRWICSECNKVIPTGEGIQLNRKPYCEKCAYIELERFETKMRNLKTKGEKENELKKKTEGNLD